MMAKAFLRQDFGYFNEILVYCSGVSDSKASNPAAFHRERLLLKEMLVLAAHAGQPLIYFGTCSIYDSLTNSSPYLEHKILLESLVS